MLALGFALACPTVLAPQVRLSDPFPRPVVGTVQVFAAGKQGSRLVYLADQEQQGELCLYGAPIDGGGPALKLSPDGVTVRRSLVVSDDGARVAFLTEPLELHVAPLDGSSAALQLTGSIPMEDSDVFPLAFSPDGQWIVYREEPWPVGPASLVSVRTDGSSAPLALDSSLNQQVYRYAIDANSTRVVYILEGELFSVLIDGSGAPVQLGPLVPAQGVSSFQLTADGSRVVFQAGLGNTHLYAVPSDGSSAPILVSSTSGTSGLALSQESYAITPAGTHVVFLADLEVDDRFELYRAPLDASQAPTRLSGPSLANREIVLFRISPDGHRIVYLDSVGFAFDGLYLTDADGSVPAVRLNTPGDDGILFPPPAFTPDSRTLVFKLFRDGNVGELYSVAVERVRRGDRPRTRRISAPLAPGSGVTNFSLSVGGRHALYTSSGLADGRSGSFAVPVHGGASIGLTPAVAPGGWAGATYPISAELGALRANLDSQSGGSLYTQSLDDGALVGPLNGALAKGAAVGHVNVYEVTPAGEVLYVADGVHANQHELHRVPADGSAAPVRLSGAMGPGGSLGGSTQPPGILTVSGDGARFAYIADQAVDQRNDLYAGPVDGGSPAVAIAVPAMGVGGGVQPGMRFTPDGARLVFRSRDVSSSRLELFSAPFDGSAPPESLSEAPSSGSVTVDADFTMTGDGARVLYRSDEATLGKFELFSVPTDGSATRIRLNAGVPSTRDVTAFRLGTDSTTVVYLADRDVDERFELYHVAATGGTVTALDPPLLAGTDVTTFELTPDAARVVYRADRDLDEQYELYSVASTGGASVRLNGALVAGGDVGFAGVSPGIALTANGRRVVFVADGSVDESFELHAAPVDGAASALRVSGTLLVEHFPWPFALTPDSRQVVFLARATLPGLVRAWVAPLDAGAAPRELPVPTGHDALAFALDPSGLTALVTSRDPLSFETYTLQRVELASGRTELLVENSASLFKLGFTFPPGRGLFLASLESTLVLELFSVRLPRFPRPR